MLWSIFLTPNRVQVRDDSSVNIYPPVLTIKYSDRFSDSIQADKGDISKVSIGFAEVIQFYVKMIHPARFLSKLCIGEKLPLLRAFSFHLQLLARFSQLLLELHDF